MPVKPMPENLLLDLIFDHFQTRSEFMDWKETVICQIDELYKFKEKYWGIAAEMKLNERRDHDIKEKLQSIFNGGDN
jgi:hypothetical protein